MGETIQGSSTIRAFKKNEEFIKANNKLLNNNILAVQMMQGVNSWFSIRIDILAICVMLSISFICVFFREYTDPIILCMLLSYTMTI
jgi:hypothetical protein